MLPHKTSHQALAQRHQLSLYLLCRITLIFFALSAAFPAPVGSRAGQEPRISSKHLLLSFLLLPFEPAATLPCIFHFSNQSLEAPLPLPPRRGFYGFDSLAPSSVRLSLFSIQSFLQAGTSRFCASAQRERGEALSDQPLLCPRSTQGSDSRGGILRDPWGEALGACLLLSGPLGREEGAEGS